MFVTFSLSVNLKVAEGSLVAIVGEVGSGKSSLINGILGELDKLSGSVNVKVHIFQYLQFLLDGMAFDRRV